jgi:folate-binding protein YgfZ
LQEVRAGLPQVFEANVEAFVPQMLNLDRVNGLSFRKGCYPGQEIVARTRYLGKLKRRMYRGIIDSQTPPSPGTEVVSKADGAKVGNVVLSAPDPVLGSEFLAVLQIAAAETQDLQVDGHAIILKDLPYSVEETGE